MRVAMPRCRCEASCATCSASIMACRARGWGGAAYQLAAIFKWTDLIYTHFSARVPGTEDFLINPYGLMFDEITASSLVRIDAEGKIIDDPLDMGVNEA